MVLTWAESREYPCSFHHAHPWDEHAVHETGDHKHDVRRSSEPDMDHLQAYVTSGSQ